MYYIILDGIFREVVNKYKNWLNKKNLNERLYEFMKFIKVNKFLGVII
jgi:hypothetical protein